MHRVLSREVPLRLGYHESGGARVRQRDLTTGCGFGLYLFEARLLVLPGSLNCVVLFVLYDVFWQEVECFSSSWRYTFTLQ